MSAITASDTALPLQEQLAQVHTLESIGKITAQVHDPNPNPHSPVYKLWASGSITVDRGGPHDILLPPVIPVQREVASDAPQSANGRAYAVCSRSDADKIRRRMAELYAAEIQPIADQAVDFAKFPAIEAAATLSELATVANALHDAELPSRLHSSDHVFKLWTDGEVTWQKGGSVYGMRNMHVRHFPMLPPGMIKPLEFPEQCGEDGYVICAEDTVILMRHKMARLFIQHLRK